MQKTES